MALQRLFAMEKTSGIWTQRMAIQVEGESVCVKEKESGSVDDNRNKVIREVCILPDAVF